MHASLSISEARQPSGISPNDRPEESQERRQHLGFLLAFVYAQEGRRLLKDSVGQAIVAPWVREVFS
jgi:hypothetical protein